MPETPKTFAGWIEWLARHPNRKEPGWVALIGAPFVVHETGVPYAVVMETLLSSSSE